MMSRIEPPNLLSEDPEVREFCGKLRRVRGERLENIFVMLAGAPALGEGVLAMATALRTSQLLSRQLRELAVLSVGITLGARYEVEHHWRSALKVGLCEEKLKALTCYRTSDLFSRNERSVIAYAIEATQGAKVDELTWGDLEFLGDGERLELVLTVAWYNAVCRVILSLDLEVEDWLDECDIPDRLEFARA
jgi:alkylhydroperoxidase family enzyme